MKQPIAQGHGAGEYGLSGCIFKWGLREWVPYLDSADIAPPSMLCIPYTRSPGPTSVTRMKRHDYHTIEASCDDLLEISR